MSIQALAWALNHQDLPLDGRTGQPSSTCAFVLIALANHAQDTGTDSFPSVATIQWYTKLSERTVRNALRALEEHGTISRTVDPLIRRAVIRDPGRQPESYDLVAMGHDRDPSGRGVVRPAEAAKGGKVDGPRGAKSTTYTSDQGGKVGGEFAPEPSLNHRSKEDPLKHDPSEADASADGQTRTDHDDATPALFPADPDREPSTKTNPAKTARTRQGKPPTRRSGTTPPNTRRRGVQTPENTGGVTGTTPSPRKSPHGGAVGQESASEPGAVTAQTVTGAWVDAYRAGHQGMQPTRSQVGQAARTARELLDAGNPAERVLAAASAAGHSGWPNIARQLAMATAPAGAPPGTYKPFTSRPAGRTQAQIDAANVRSAQTRSIFR